MNHSTTIPTILEQGEGKDKMGDSDKSIRCFLAVQPEDNVITSLVSLCDEFRSIALGKRIKWTSAENLHITIRFLGAIKPQSIRNICNNLSYTLKDTQSFDIYLSAPHLFPNRKRATLLAAITRDDKKLSVLANAVESALERSGIEPEGRKFRGHITLARSKSQIKDHEILLQCETSVLMRVNNVVLFKSELTPAGANYSVIEKFEFV